MAYLKGGTVVDGNLYVEGRLLFSGEDINNTYLLHSDLEDGRILKAQNSNTAVNTYIKEDKKTIGSKGSLKNIAMYTLCSEQSTPTTGVEILSSNSSTPIVQLKTITNGTDNGTEVELPGVTKTYSKGNITINSTKTVQSIVLEKALPQSIITNDISNFYGFISYESRFTGTLIRYNLQASSGKDQPLTFKEASSGEYVKYDDNIKSQTFKRPTKWGYIYKEPTQDTVTSYISMDTNGGTGGELSDYSYTNKE